MAENYSSAALNTLLPAARMHVFTDDEHTQELFITLQGDWRFGRIQMEQFAGGIDAAILRYADAPSPSVLIIQTDDISDAFQAKLAKLSQVCDEGTSALIIGPVNDVQLYRKLTGLGISDYLVHPVSLFVMAEAVARTVLNMLGASSSKLVAVIGAKGGLGTTNISQILALAAANDYKTKTLLMDAAAGQSTLWAQFGLTPTGSLVEAAKAAIDRDHDTLSRILVAIDENLTLMNTGAEPILEAGSSRQIFETMLERMLAQYPLVVVDLSSTTNHIRSSVLGRAQAVFVVTSPMVQSLSLCKTLLAEIRNLRGNDSTDIRLIVNKRGEQSQYEVNGKDIETAFAMDVAVEIPYQPKLFLRAESESEPVSNLPEGKALSENLGKQLQTLLKFTLDNYSETKEKKSGLQGLLNKLRGQ